MSKAWDTVPLGELLSLRSGKAIVGRNELGRYPIFGSNGRIGRSDDCNSPKDSIIIGRVGANCGSVTYSPNDCWVTDNALVALANERSDSYFLYHLLSSLRLNSRSQGSGQPLINQQIIKTIPVKIPALPEQRAVAGVLRMFDALIDANRGLMEDLDSWYQAEWHRLFSESLLGDERIPLSELVSTQYGYTASATDVASDPRFLRVMDINKRNWIDWSSVPHCPISPNDLDRYRLRKGDILVARMADPGKSAIVDDDLQDAVFASYLVRLKPKNRVYSQYIYGLLKSPFYVEYAAGAAGGSVQKNMNAKVITGVCFGKPSIDAVRKFDDFGAEVRTSLNALQDEATELIDARDALLPLLLSGKISPSNAAKLLEGV